jgi:hypothetical protein
MTESVTQRTGPQIGNHDVIGELAILSTVEEQLDALRSDRPTEQLFRIIDRWLVRDDILRDHLLCALTRKTRGATAAIPNFPVRGPFFTLRHLFFAYRVDARTSASAISFMSNLRAFYVDRQPLTLWVAMQRQPVGNFPKTMAIRSRLASTPGLRMPRIITHDAAADPPYILEELISGRPFGQPADWDLLVDKLVPSLFHFYDQESIRHCRVTEIFDAKQIYRGITNLIPNFRWEKRGMLPPAQLLESAEQCLRLSEETMPLCTGHGDLARANLLVADDGDLTLVDCEWSRELPIAEELVKLIRYMVRERPQLVRVLASALRLRTEDPVAMPPKRQFLIVILDKIASLSNLGMARKAEQWVRLASTLTTGPEW